MRSPSGPVPTLQGPMELVWPDLLLLAWQRHPDLLRARAVDHLEVYASEGGRDSPVDPLRLPAVMELASRDEPGGGSATARAWLRDLWMF